MILPMLRYLFCFCLLLSLNIPLLAQFDASCYDDRARSLFERCLKKRKIYPKYPKRIDKSFFDGVSLHPVPVCTLVGDSLCLLPDATPYLILITRGDDLVGVLSTDDRGHSYIDVDFIYDLSFEISDLWRLMRESDVTLCNLTHTPEYVLFSQVDGKTVYVSLYEQADSLSGYSFKPLDSLPDCFFYCWRQYRKRLSRLDLRNHWRDMHIAYD